LRNRAVNAYVVEGRTTGQKRPEEQAGQQTHSHEEAPEETPL
jgi:hypothetical protein